MVHDSDDSRTVRLRTRRLAAEMERRGVTAARLAAIAGGPSRRTIYRWLSGGAAAADGLAPAEWAHVCTVARALRLQARDLVEVAPDAWDQDRERWVRLAAAFGPRVYPSLMRHLGFGMPLVRVNQAGDVIEPTPREVGEVTYHRFAQWSVCEAILRDQTLLPSAHARSGLEWAERMGLDLAAAPELMCLCALALGDEERSLEAALAWMRRALQGGSLLEARWVGARVLGTSDPSSSEPRAEIALLLAFVCSVSGDPRAAIGVLSDLVFPGGGALRGALRGRAHLELARAYHRIGQMPAALAEADAAAGALGFDAQGEVRVYWFEALLERTHLLQEMGRVEAADEALEEVDRVVRTTPDAAVSRFYRLLGIGALDRGDVREAREHFETAVDIAEGRGNAREAGMGQCNVAIACALVGDDEEAKMRFEQALALVSGGDLGPTAIAIVHRNIAEFELDLGHYEGCRRLARIAMAGYEKGGQYALVSRCRAMVAEALAREGSSVEALVEARAAHRDAVEAGSVLDQALALAVSALASQGTGQADSLADAAERLLGSLPSVGQTIPRLAIARRCATARLRGPHRTRARQDLELLRNRAIALGVDLERRRIDAVLLPSTASQ